MSSGKFSRAKYAADYGDGSNIHPIRVQPETLAFTVDGTANSSPAGATTSPISARATGGKRTLGLNARTVSFAFSSAVPDGYEPGEPLRLPVLNKTLWGKIGKGAVGTYLGESIEVLGRSAETAG